MQHDKNVRKETNWKHKESLNIKNQAKMTELRADKPVNVAKWKC